MITHLKTSGFIFGNFDEEIPQKIVLIGRNGSGKTSRLRAIQFCLTGNITGFDKQPKRLLEDFAASSGAPRLQSILTVNGKTWTRICEVKGTGGTMKAIPDNLPDIPFVMFDMKQFFELSAVKKQDYLFGLALQNAPVGEFSNKLILDKVKDNILAQEFAKAVQGYESFPFFEFLQYAIKEASALKSKYNKAKMEAKANHANLTRKLIEIQAQAQRLEDVRKTILELSEQKGKLQKEIDDCAGIKKGYEVAEQSIAKARTEIQTLQSELKQSEQKKLTLQGLKANPEQVNENFLDMLADEKKDIEKNLNRAKGIKISLDDIIFKLKSGICPTCGQKTGEAYKEFTDRSEKLKLTIEKLQASANDAEKRYQDYFMKVQSFKKKKDEIKALEEFIMKDAEREAKIKALQSEIIVTEKAVSEMPALSEISAEQTQAQLEGLRSRIETLQSEIKELEKDKNTEVLCEQARLDHLSYEEKWRAAQEIEKELQTMRAEKLNALLEPLFISINQSLPAGLSLHYNSEITAIFSPASNKERARHVQFEKMSTGEMALVLPGLIAGILNFTQNPFKPVFLDNFEALDEQNRVMLLQKLSQMVDDKIIDQFIVAGCCGNFSLLDKATISGVVIRNLSI